MRFGRLEWRTLGAFRGDPVGRHTARLRSIAEHATSMSTTDSSADAYGLGAA